MSARTKTKNPSKNPSWLVPGILLAGVLLIIGALIEGSSMLVVVTLLIVAVSLTSAGNSNRRGDRDRR